MMRTEQFQPHDRPSIPPAPERNYYWHAGITGRDGGVLDSILKKGLLPKSQHEVDAGNPLTINKGHVYASNFGAAAANYLKNANNYRWGTGGLPFFVGSVL